MRLRAAAAISILSVAATAAQDGPIPTFGTTVVIPSGLRGDIYQIKKDSQRLPDFTRLKPKGSIYTSALNVPIRDFREGFPGVSKRIEWFAIDYHGRFWIENPGKYDFFLMSDDGSRLYIDDRAVINNDGIHAAHEEWVRMDLEGGIHTMRVSYFQGPRYQVALVLRIAVAGQRPRVFSTDDYKPPPNPEDWKFGPGRGGK